MIPEFYKDREIFLTGGSGIVGKALIEKLLRSCNVRKIYILLRPKRNFTIEERLKKIKKEMIFRRVLSEKPNEFDEKITAIPGDVELPNLGITPESAKLLENVSILIHSAATVRFDETLKDAISLNVGGTVEALKYGETLKHLELFMHVSTFYSNPYLKYVDTKLYDAPMDWKFCLDLCKRNDIPDEMLDSLTRKLIVGFPNTYCFTKNLAESAVNDYRHKLPVAIYRPSIVIHALEEPEPGFPPALMGAMGLFVVSAAGILKTLPMPKNQRLDLSPQDFAVKTLLYYIVKSVKMYENARPDEIPIFHMSSCTHSLLTFPEYIGICMDFKFWMNLAADKSFLLPGLVVTGNMIYYRILFFLKQLLPSLLLDFILRMSGRKPALMKIQRKLYSTVDVMKPFMFNTYGSSGISNAREMLDELNGTEFNVDVLRELPKFYPNVGFARDMIYKCREILLKEDPATIPRARMVARVKLILYRTVQLYLAYRLYTRWIDPVLYQREWSWDSNNNSTLIANI